jgi:phage recombination protein Bet
MTTAITKPNTNATTKPNALAMMASRLNVDPARLQTILKSTVFAKANDDEFAALVVICQEYNLNPILKEIYAFPAKGGGIVPIVSVDGWNKFLISHPQFDGIEYERIDDAEGNLHACKATVHMKNRSHPMVVTEYLSECKRNTEPWNTMPWRMLRNRTTCQAARMAFGFSGVYNDDEAKTITVESTVMPSEPPPKLVAAPATTTAQAELEALVTGEGFTFNHLQKFGVETGNITNADSLASWDEIPTDEAKRLLKAKTGLINGLKAIKG